MRCWIDYFVIHSVGSMGGQVLPDRCSQGPGLRNRGNKTTRSVVRAHRVECVSSRPNFLPPQLIEQARMDRADELQGYDTLRLW